MHKHVSGAHDLTADEYREQFGIPWGRSLISPSFKARQAEIMAQQRAEGKLPATPTPEHIAMLHERAKLRRSFVATVKNAQSRHALSLHGRAEKLSHADFEEYLRRIATGRTITEVGRDPDMMRRETFDSYCRENPEFKAKVEKVLDDLPPAVQVRGQCVGDSLKKLIVLMRETYQMTWPEIGQTLGLNENTPRGIYHRLKRFGQLEALR